MSFSSRPSLFQQLSSECGAGLVMSQNPVMQRDNRVDNLKCTNSTILQLAPRDEGLVSDQVPGSHESVHLVPVNTRQEASSSSGTKRILH